MPSYFSYHCISKAYIQSRYIMKINRPLRKIISLLLVAGAFTFHACMTVSYVGDRYPPTEQVDVYYAEKDVKAEYRVIGHLSEKVSGPKGEERAKQQIL